MAKDEFTTVKEILDVNIDCWRNEYNRNRDLRVKESGYQHMPNKILMSKETWDVLIEDFVINIYADQTIEAELIEDPAVEPKEGPSYMGVHVEFRDMYFKEFIVQ